MSTELLLYVMAGAVVVSALALISQAVVMIFLWRSVKALREQVETLLPKVESALGNAEATLQDARKQVTDVTTKANEALESAKAQLKRTDDFLTEATSRARIQLDRVELVLDDTISRVHETVVILNKGVLRPVREINGLVAGLRTAFAFLLRGGRPNVSQATTDEEMFI